MPEVKIEAKIPFLWGDEAFRKRRWAQVNLIVGPNGSGKTLLAERIARGFEGAGYGVIAFCGERADGASEDALIAALREDREARLKIESVLSGMFSKSIRLEKDGSGRLVPMVVNKPRGVEYSLHEGECHGLKEILMLLAVLYGRRGGVKGRGGKACFIFDEPELHLHPQMQMFFMGEIRREAAKSPSSVFFLITHSPFFIDLRFPDDLAGVVACHTNRAPTSIEELSGEDAALFQRFLPRFNTYHKQFFFSDRQVFVEGYTDAQVFSALLSALEGARGAAGTGVIDVGGKDELGVFFKVCSLLGTDSRIIADLDSLFRGKLKDVLCEDARPGAWLKENEEAHREFFASIFPQEADAASKAQGGKDAADGATGAATLRRLIARLEDYLSDIGAAALSHAAARLAEGTSPAGGAAQSGAPLSPQEAFLSKAMFFARTKDAPADLDAFKTVVLQAAFVPNALDFLADSGAVSARERDRAMEALPKAKRLAGIVLAAAEAARVYVLERGCIEHYYAKSKVEYLPIAAKDKLFHAERNFMLSLKPEALRKIYAPLADILERALS